MKTCCFTGHRLLPRGERDEVVQKLEEQIEQLIQEGMTDFVCGGAHGFDLLAGSVIIERRKMCREIRLILLSPCRDQDAKWTDKQKAEYRELLAAADDIQYVAETYYDGCMKERNRRMVEMSGTCIAYLRNPRSGTGQTFRMAERQGLRIVLL